MRRIAIDRRLCAPAIQAGDFSRLADDIDIWDAWPVQAENGVPVLVAEGTTLWMALASPRFADPDERHRHARIHLLQHDRSGWLSLGPVMPDGYSPGSREWSGSTVLAKNGTDVALYFTAAGERSELEPGFRQRLFVARAKLEGAPGGFQFTGWHGLEEFVRRDPVHYMASDAGGAEPGKIKAFRDPAYFRDPVSGAHYVLFAASLAGSTSAFNGVVGAAIAHGEEPKEWTILPPIVSADGLNNELERPHLVRHAGLYYLFWSTQREVFDSAGPVGPTGLYGMVSDRLDRGWEPLNGSALVFANPPESPRQAYSWLVLPDLTVVSFVDDWGPVAQGRPRRFGGAFAPALSLRLEGDKAGLAPD